jgi:hypothetical protein
MKNFSIFFIFGVMGLSGSSLFGMQPSTNTPKRRTNLQLVTYDAFARECLNFYHKKIDNKINSNKMYDSDDDNDAEDARCIKALKKEGRRLHGKWDGVIGFNRDLGSTGGHVEHGDDGSFHINLQKKQLDTLHGFRVDNKYGEDVTHLNIADNNLRLLRLNFIVSQCRNLQVLHAEDNGIETIIAEDPLIKSRPWTESKLSHIFFNRNQLTVKELVALINSPNFPNLEHIEVKQNPPFLPSEFRDGSNANDVIKNRFAQSRSILEPIIMRQSNGDDFNTIVTTYSTPTKTLLTIVASNK